MPSKRESKTNAWWTIPEITRAARLMDAGLCYSCIGKLLYLDGLSPHVRSRGSVRAKLRDEGYTMPKRKDNHHNKVRTAKGHP